MCSWTEPIRLWNEQHELCERTFQLICCHSRHFHRNGWRVRADDGSVRAHALRATIAYGHIENNTGERDAQRETKDLVRFRA